jgi:ABC-type sulfate transport system substrate-binding protein
VVDAVAEQRRGRGRPQFLNYWYSKEGQEIAARNLSSARTRSPKKYAVSFPGRLNFNRRRIWRLTSAEGYFGEGGIF